MDMAISPYLFQGTGANLQVAYNRFKGRCAQEVLFNLASSTLTADVPGMYSVNQQYYSLQYMVARRVASFKQGALYAGGTLSARAFMRNTPNDLTGEAIGSLELSVAAHTQIAPWYRLTAILSIPVMSGLLFRGYGLGEEEFMMSSWGNYQAGSLRIFNFLRLGERWSFMVGYSIMYSNYSYSDQVRSLIQQYSAGFSVTVDKKGKKD